jgi:uncharacterized repeat protein (TIGR01451 family)
MEGIFMKKIKRFKALLTILLALIMTFILLQSAFADEQLDFPLLALNGDLVADQNTLFVIELEQNPLTKFIKASVTISNNTSGAEARELKISAVSFQVSFDSRLCPYRYDPLIDGNNQPYEFTRFYQGGLELSDVELRKYCYTPISNFKTISSSAFMAPLNSSSPRFIGATITAATDQDNLSITPGAKLTIAELYFMPLQYATILDYTMFKFEFHDQTSVPGLGLIRLSNWLGNGDCFLFSDRRSANSSNTYIVNKAVVLGEQTNVSQSFKLHILQKAPTHLFADLNRRIIADYNPATMEWSLTITGPYTGSHPIVPLEGAKYYVRYKESFHIGNDPVYFNYYKYVASEPHIVSFLIPVDIRTYPQTSKTLTLTSPDGRMREGDSLLYTITVKNAGQSGSIWKNVVLTDILKDGVTFGVFSVRLDGVMLWSGFGYTFEDRVLTVPLGNIPGQTQRVVTFEVTVDSGAGGKIITNECVAIGKEGESDIDIIDYGWDGNTHPVMQISAKPTIDTVTVGDSIISGIGERGAMIIVYYPNSTLTSMVTTVNSNGIWNVYIPYYYFPSEGDTIQAMQILPGYDPSGLAETIVRRSPEIFIGKKERQNLTRPNADPAEVHVGDRLLYTITSSSDGNKSLWANTTMTDVMPDGLTYVEGSVLLNNMSPTYAFYDRNTRTLSVMLPNMPDILGVMHTITFEAIVDANAFGKQICNEVTIKGEDSVSGLWEETVREWDGGFIVKDKSELPDDKFNFGVYLQPEKTTYKAGDNFYVDVMLAGNINYTQIMAEITFDDNLLQYDGHANLAGWAAACTPAGADKILIRSVPSMNMVLGTPCSPAKNIVTLKFTVLNGFTEERVNTNLNLGSIIVSPPAGYIGATTAPGKPVAITLYQP